MDTRRDTDLIAADYWRNCAADARAMADEQSDPTAKAILDAIAHKYDVLAEQAARIRTQRS